jgi:hypothetical protein
MDLANKSTGMCRDPTPPAAFKKARLFLAAILEVVKEGTF